MSFDAERLTETLMLDEGFNGRPYTDTEGKVTIGFGRNLTDNPLTKEESAYLMRGPIAQVERDLDRRLSWWRDLDPVRQQVLANMAYNLGIVRLCGFVRMLAAAKAGLWHNAAEEMINSKWAEQVGARAHRLAKQMETGVA